MNETIYKCPFQDKGIIEWSCISGCESSGIGQGCNKLKECPVYQYNKKKAMEKYNER